MVYLTRNCKHGACQAKEQDFHRLAPGVRAESAPSRRIACAGCISVLAMKRTALTLALLSACTSESAAQTPATLTPPASNLTLRPTSDPRAPSPADACFETCLGQRNLPDGPDWSVVASGLSAGKMLAGCGFEAVQVTYDEWLGEGPQKFIVLDVRILTTDKANACMLDWIAAEGGSPIPEPGTTSEGSSGSESTG